jgi:hypothetical protein
VIEEICGFSSTSLLSFRIIFFFWVSRWSLGGHGGVARNGVCLFLIKYEIFFFFWVFDARSGHSGSR